MLLHIFGHIQANQGIHAVEQIISQLLHQFGLTHTGGTNEDEGHRPLLGGQTNAVATDCLGNGIHRLILTHDMSLKPVCQALNLLILLSLNLGGRNLRPQLNNPGQILHRHLRRRHLLQLLNFSGNTQKFAAQGRQTLVMLVLGIIRQHPQLQLVIIPLLLQLRQLGDFLTPQVYIGTSLVQQIDSLVRQEAIRDIPLGQNNTLARNLRRDAHAVELGIGLRNALHNLAGFLDGGFCHGHRLEPTLQGRILFDMLAVFIKGGRTNHLDFATG